MLIIRKAMPEDSQSFVNLFLLSAPYFPIVFGKNIVYNLWELFQRRKNLFSYEHTFFAEIDGERAGMLLGYDWNTKNRENLNTGLMLLRFGGFKMLLLTPTYLKFNNTVGQFEKGEYYISNVAVYEIFRGKGVGRLLMQLAEDEAKNCGSMKIVLDVERGNVNAINFYRSLGFEENVEFHISLEKGFCLNFLRMIKVL